MVCKTLQTRRFPAYYVSTQEDWSQDIWTTAGACEASANQIVFQVRKTDHIRKSETKSFFKSGRLIKSRYLKLPAGTHVQTTGGDGCTCKWHRPSLQIGQYLSKSTQEDWSIRKSVTTAGACVAPNRFSSRDIGPGLQIIPCWRSKSSLAEEAKI